MDDGPGLHGQWSRTSWATILHFLNDNPAFHEMMTPLVELLGFLGAYSVHD